MSASVAAAQEVWRRVTTIRLGREWQLGTSIAQGGFGKVVEATDAEGLRAAVKLVPKAPGAHRELLFEELTGLRNIVPIIDKGEWDDYYVLVMPRADKSLRQHLGDLGGRLDVVEVVRILTDVATALAGLRNGVVHRDLKPENVLLLDGSWSVADFGIARYAEATTAAETHKYSMTPAYAAPEQWRGERATSATDVYAFGVIAFELLQGTRPFPGPEFREQHLNEPPLSLGGIPLSLANLVLECLYKASGSRPSPENILARLQRIQEPLSGAAVRLQQINQAVVEEQVRHGAAQSAQRSREDSRQELLQVARQSLQQISLTLRDRAIDAAPAARASAGRSIVELSLNNGKLVVEQVQPAPAGCLAAHESEPPFDVVAHALIAAKKPQDRYGYEGRSHSLWFCDAWDEGRFRWFELAFMIMPLMRAQATSVDPFALPPTDPHAAGAFWHGIDVRQLDWEPLAFDQGDEEQFIERWLDWFAAAADGSLSRPSAMPEKSGGHHRSGKRRA